MVFTYFTIFAITQTLSVESITCLVNALPTTRILTIVSIGMSTFWKIHFVTYSWVLFRAFEICCIITMVLLFLRKSMKNLTSLSPIEQSWTLQPALQEHRPSVCRHVLQCGKQGKEQFVPKYSGWQALETIPSFRNSSSGRVVILAGRHYLHPVYK